MKYRRDIGRRVGVEAFVKNLTREAGKAEEMYVNGLDCWEI